MEEYSEQYGNLNLLEPL
jgi:hypothetical protein